MGVAEIVYAVGALLAANQAYENSGAQTPRPTTPAPEPEKQAPQTPDANVYRRRNANAAGVLGPGSTLLSGLQGVPDSMLKLGSHTLLGQ